MDMVNKGKKKKILVLLVLYVIVLISAVLVAVVIYKLNYVENTPISLISEDNQETIIGSLSLHTDSTNINSGENFEVVISGSAENIVAVDVIINYSTEMFEVVEIKTSDDFNVFPIIKAENGQILLSGLTDIETAISGEFTLGTLLLKPISTGSTTLEFDYVPKSTIDSNVVEKDTGIDLLKNIQDLTVNIL